MGGVKGGQPGIWSTCYHHNPVHYLWPAGPSRAYHASFCRSTKSRVLWWKHRQWTKLRAVRLFEWIPSSCLFRGGESGWVPDFLLYHIHLFNVKTWLLITFGLFHTPIPLMDYINPSGEYCCRQLHATVLAYWLFNHQIPCLPLCDRLCLEGLVIKIFTVFIHCHQHVHLF